MYAVVVLLAAVLDTGATVPVGSSPLARACSWRPAPGGRFGARRDGGHRRHAGLDLGKDGDPVYAIDDGRITVLHWQMPGHRGSVPWIEGQRAPRKVGRGGLMIFVDHGAGRESRYMHLAAPAKGIRVGSVVRAGQQIAIAGHTGIKRSAPHLHFEFRVNGKAQDPWPIIANLPSPSASPKGGAAPKVPSEPQPVPLRQTLELLRALGQVMNSR